ncbi:unnamed protein product [Mytilus edulis]|uniref:Uncharacterized protein n=1 Tax=Mytilus edulis TaxID=6550 RepID=A0A8S3VKL5_MYTED|nr:unnamed protein product [Mytilus edulis]
MMEKESKRPPCFKISVPGDDSKKKDVLDKLQHVRSIIVKETHSVDNSETKMENMNLNTYIQVEKKDVDQQLFVTAETSLQKLVSVSENHSSFCTGHFKLKKRTQKGHVAAIRFTCDKDKHHSVLWSSSPYLPNGEYMANSRIFHGYDCKQGIK